MLVDFQPGEGPSSGYLRDYESSDGSSFQALADSSVEAGSEQQISSYLDISGNIWYDSWGEGQCRPFVTRLSLLLPTPETLFLFYRN